jgi:NADPH:quinone reductase-like Zn-dependent oxidoreductase
MTAWLMLVDLANVQSGQWVLIHSAAGGVGQAAVQICRWKDARVIGTASPAKHDRLRSGGVEHCIDSSARDFDAQVLDYTRGRGVDVALDPLGGRALRRSYRCLAPLGRLICFGVSSMVGGRTRSLPRLLREWFAMPRFHPLELLQSSRGVIGVTLGALQDDVDRRRRMLAQVVEMTTAGRFNPVLDRMFPLEDAGAAHQHLQDRRNFGKVLLVTQ